MDIVGYAHVCFSNNDAEIKLLIVEEERLDVIFRKLIDKWFRL